MKSVFPFVTPLGDELYRVALSLWIFAPSTITGALSMRGLVVLPDGFFALSLILLSPPPAWQLPLTGLIPGYGTPAL